MRVFICLLFLMPLYVGAQESDLASWNSITIETEINKDLKISLESELRLDNNISRPYVFFSSPAVDYDIHKHIRLGLAYRFSIHISDRDQSHRATAEIVFRKLSELFTDKSRLDASLRIRGTRETYQYSRTESHLRSKLALSYNLPKTKWEPKAAFEFFYRFDQQLIYTFEEVKGVSGWDKYRFRLGASYPLSKRSDLFMYYQFQNGFNDSALNNIIGLSYTQELKLK